MSNLRLKGRFEDEAGHEKLPSEELSFTLTSVKPIHAAHVR
jgi:hypothetical protein